MQINLPSKISSILTALFFICSSIFFGLVSLDFPAGGELFPLFLFGSIIFLSLLLILETLLKTDSQKLISIKLDFYSWKPFFVSIAVIIHVIFIFILGYFTSSFLFLVGCSFLIGLRDARAIGITAVILFPLMYAFFEIFLKASLPSGILF